MHNQFPAKLSSFDLNTVILRGINGPGEKEKVSLLELLLELIWPSAVQMITNIYVTLYNIYCRKVQTVNASANSDEPPSKGQRGSEAAFKGSLRRGWGEACLQPPLCPLTRVWRDVTAEKRRYRSGQLPMSVHSSKVAMPVNCEACPFPLWSRWRKLQETQTRVPRADWHVFSLT